MDKKDFICQYNQTLSKYKIELPDNSRDTIGNFFYELYEANHKINLTGYQTVQEYIVFHLIDTLNILELFPVKNQTSLIDIGTGCGVPGMLIKFLNPAIDVYLVDSVNKKVNFLFEVVDKLGIKGCFPIHSRAEDLAKTDLFRERIECVFARALGTIGVSIELASGFAKPEGYIVLPRGAEGVDKSYLESLSESLFCSLESDHFYQLPQRNTKYHVLIFKKTGNLPEKYPRKPGQIKKRPL